MSGVFYGLLWILFNGLARLLFRFRIEGSQHFPKTGGIIVAANHASYFDIPLLGCAIPRRVFFFRESELISQSVSELGLAKARLDPFKNAQTGQESLRAGTLSFASR